MTLPYPVIATDKPCAVCGKEIQPGQLYVPGPKPRHLGCADRVCYYCGHAVVERDSPIQALTRNAWAHFTCWYDRVVPSRLQNASYSDPAL